MKCRGCQYDLSGLPQSGACPECGKHVAESSKPQERVRTSRVASVITGLSIGIGLTPVALVLGFISAGSGHGDYVLARAIFPWSIALTALQGEGVTPLLFVLAMVQWPLYGCFIGSMLRRGPRGDLAIVALVLLHIAAAWFTFSGMVTGFT